MKRYYAHYLKEIIQLFRKFKNDFNENELNIFITESIFSLLEIKKIDLNDLICFTSKEFNDLEMLIQPKNGILFQQPSIILTLYFFYNHRTFLESNWPLNRESLKSIYKSTGTSFSEYQ